MSANIKTGGTWQKLASMPVKIAGTWESVQSGWLKTGGVWERFFVSGEPALTNDSVSHSNPGGLAHAGYAFDPDGTLYEIGPGSFDRTLVTAGEWWTTRPVTDIGASYEVRCASVGAGQSWDTQAAAVGTWVDISVERAWRVRVTAMDAPLANACDGVFEIRLLGGDGTVLATATLSAFASN